MTAVTDALDTREDDLPCADTESRIGPFHQTHFANASQSLRVKVVASGPRLCTNAADKGNS